MHTQRVPLAHSALAGQWKAELLRRICYSSAVRLPAAEGGCFYVGKENISCTSASEKICEKKLKKFVTGQPSIVQRGRCVHIFVIVNRKTELLLKKHPNRRSS